MPAMAPEPSEEEAEAEAGAAVVGWALEGVVVADVDADVELADEEAMLVEPGAEPAEEDPPEMPLAVRLT
jgi:hypothetical protein